MKIWSKLVILAVLAGCWQMTSPRAAVADEKSASISELDAKIEALEKFLQQLRAERNSRQEESEDEGEDGDYFASEFGESDCYNEDGGDANVNEGDGQNNNYEQFFGDRDRE